MKTTLKAYIPKSIKDILKRLPVRFTQNQRYDHQTKRILNQVLTNKSNCIDVGCFKGEILDLLIEKAYKGRHFAFEPIPDKFSDLREKYKDQPQVVLHNIAVSNCKGTSTFNHVVTNPSYSGLKKRDYDLPDERDQQITVDTDMLDSVIPVDATIDLIKIDVEGAEYLVLEGGKALISRCRPITIFEHGLGGSNHYGNGPDKVFDFFKDCKMNISNLDSYLNKKSPLSKEDFCNQYFKKLNYYFVAHP